MFRLIGFVVLLIAIRLFMPSVFFSVEHALISLFDLAGNIFSIAPTDITTQMSAPGGINYIPKAAPLPSAFVMQ